MEILNNNEPQLQILTPGISVIEVFMSEGIKRNKFVGLKPEHTNFKPGQRVLPAPFLNGVNNNDVVYFKEYHDPGTKGWLIGGYECTDISGAFRAFHLDALMIHPNELKSEVDILNKRVVGANKKTKQRDPNAPKGKRGRPPLSPEERAKRDALKPPRDPNAPKGRRGRTPLPLEERERRRLERIEKMKASKPKTSGRRGRKPLPPEEIARREQEKALKLLLNPQRKRGRPKRK